MNRKQWLFGLFLVALIYFVGVQADNDSGSGSGSDSNESGSGSGEKKNKHKKYNYPPPGPQPYGPPHYYNHPIYIPQGPPTPYGGYYPPPPPYYNYGYQPQPAPPMQPNYYPYPYGGYYNQPPPPPPAGPSVQQPGTATQGPQGFPGIPGGSSTINHSLKVNKEYTEDGHHYKPDGTPNE
ncbi:uncharacterized protein ACRADG_006094 [Cochliomyia hominivorax]